MELVKFQRGQTIAKRNDMVQHWYLIQEGSVTQKFEVSEVSLGKNALIGILEKDMYLCDYIATEDTVLAEFTCDGAEDLKKLLSGQEKLRGIFLRAAVEQRQQMLKLYAELNSKTRQFHMFVETVFNDYKNLCLKYKVEQLSFLRMELFHPLEMQHKAEEWEVNNSASIVHNYLQEYLQLMEKDDSMTVGVIMEASFQMRRFTQGVWEMENYLTYNKDILLNDMQSDLFQLFFDLAIKIKLKKFDIEPAAKEIQLIAKVADKLGVYNPRTVIRRLKEFKEYDFENVGNENATGSAVVRKEMDILTEDCLGHILEYAGYNDDDALVICNQIHEYQELPDMTSMDKEVYGLRKKLTSLYYEIYQKVFLRAVKDESTLTPVLEMFLHFGFMDLSLVGEERAKELYDTVAHMDICHSEHIYTIYEWLKAIYHGEKETSKNDLEMDYQVYLADLLKTGKLNQQQYEMLQNNREKMVEFEIKNMFASCNKLTYGKITTFTPILCKQDLINSVDKMLVTAERLELAMNEVRKVDYSVFYREVMFSDVEHGINCERIMKEVLPDIILMPNAGSRVAMWQEISGLRSNTPGRFMFPILTAMDLDDMMLEVVGRFRWEMCRRVEGVRWNDVREHSLTAEYCTYLQFYRKNRDLSAEVKEKIKGALVRAKNNFREVFVRDYINWMKFESKGSFRLNKVTREILSIHCPFVKAIRNELSANPIYQGTITQFESEVAKKLQRFTGVYDKYEKAGGTITAELKENLKFYQM
ncbi:MAG: cyclic nucleotide-binding domain-containing protein [Lachnospiraceae bacterium]|nr:cyclic nucleotide-binding domain-containing protein [Lachnospiraceae bacterium]